MVIKEITIIMLDTVSTFVRILEVANIAKNVIENALEVKNILFTKSIIIPILKVYVHLRLV